MTNKLFTFVIYVVIIAREDGVSFVMRSSLASV